RCGPRGCRRRWETPSAVSASASSEATDRAAARVRLGDGRRRARSPGAVTPPGAPVPPAPFTRAPTHSTIGITADPPAPPADGDQLTRIESPAQPLPPGRPLPDGALDDRRGHDRPGDDLGIRWAGGVAGDAGVPSQGGERGSHFGGRDTGSAGAAGVLLQGLRRPPAGSHEGEG